MNVTLTTANVHDSKAAYALTGGLGDKTQLLSVFKGDSGYRGNLASVIKSWFNIEL